MTHLKSLAAPRHYPKTTGVFATRPRPGPHPAHESIPLIVLVRDILGLAEDAATAKKIIKMRKILVDGKVVIDHRFPLGLMDVVSIPDNEEYYRILPFPGKGLSPLKIDAEEARFKLGQILRKMHVKGGHLQFTLHDGRNLRFKEVDEARTYRTYDTFKISIPDQTVLGYQRMEVGAYAFIHHGSKMGLHGRITVIRREVAYPDKPTVTIEGTRIGKVTTLLTHVMPVGDEKPWLALP